MPDLTASNRPAVAPTVFDYQIVGTAAGTTTISAEPAVLHAVIIPARVASGAITIYDSIGTSSSVVGTIVLGTQTFSDPPASYIFDIRTKTALTVVNTGNQGAVIAWGK